MNKFLIKRPLVSEKATSLSSIGQYVFLVDRNANKAEIKKVIEAIYKVNIKKVRIINIKSKNLALGRFVGKKPGHKKAMITLSKGQKLDILTQ